MINFILKSDVVTTGLLKPTGRSVLVWVESENDDADVIEVRRAVMDAAEEFRSGYLDEGEAFETEQLINASNPPQFSSKPVKTSMNGVRIIGITNQEPTP